MSSLFLLPSCRHADQRPAERDHANGTGIPAHTACALDGAPCGPTRWEPPTPERCPRLEPSRESCPSPGCGAGLWLDACDDAFRCPECGAVFPRVRPVSGFAGIACASRDRVENGASDAA